MTFGRKHTEDVILAGWPGEFLFGQAAVGSGGEDEYAFFHFLELVVDRLQSVAKAERQ